ncbi:M15 family metallopeptidase [Kineococcus sp. NUM-3379]
MRAGAAAVAFLAVAGQAAAAPAEPPAAPAGAATTADTGAPTVFRGSRRAAPPGRFVGVVSPVTAADLPASWRPGCPVPPERLRLLTVSHVDLAGRTRLGRLVVHETVAEPLLRVFARLYELRFPVERVEPVDAFGGSDDASMAANNTSAFNCRRTTGGTRWSEHAYGTAIDVNPVQNPYVRGTTVLPSAGRGFLDRSRPGPGVLLAGDPVVAAFGAAGFRWGGYWSSSKDYQHFSTTGR